MTATPGSASAAQDDRVNSQVCVIIPAAGSGTRLGESIPKAFVDLHGRTILERCVDQVLDLDAHVVVVVPADLVGRARLLLPPHVEVVAGGAHRSTSVRAGLAAAGDAGIILVHDAARPLTPAGVFRRVIDAIRAGHRAVIPGIPVADTLKQIEQLDTDLARVTTTVDRDLLRAIQTPQGFTREALVAAHADDEGLATDDAGLAERIGIPVHVVEGHPMAMKITTPWDLRVIRQILDSGEVVT
ncbi:2-C-methyl-D-erythritol 4-phosphate cytidylyltransferase [Gordonia sp. L191]|uniref:2-C-methyl-D-erythritol 4-phosphate cytidylyltransferase n=1 Tax=Gordonia sp. L191 TaxID=2982699 RepID=UPI0024C07347|nr:2-C-methyl-D-erythritol 4-phosphate cytidylyltransferase [Gordonia sp. L191]WHU46041.1 2-C-methyl-D-erythritol 4-phosphate cytidylyltransferase [Gordonia sp. L191]